MTELILRSDENGIATLTLNRPEALNALSPKLFVELRNHIENIASETESVGCVILRGEGRSFSAGNDLRAIQSGERAPSPHYQAETLDMIENLPQIHLPIPYPSLRHHGTTHTVVCGPNLRTGEFPAEEFLDDALRNRTTVTYLYTASSANMGPVMAVAENTP